MMGLRAWLGLCEHQWEETDEMIRHYVQSVVTPKQQMTTGFSKIMRCKKCGSVKSVRL